MLGLTGYWLPQVSAQIFENLLFSLLDFEQDRFRQPQVILPGMNLASFQKDSPQITDALLSQQHCIIGLNHDSSSSTIPRFRKLLEF